MYKILLFCVDCYFWEKDFFYMCYLVEKSGVRVLVGFCVLYINKGFKEKIGLKREKYNIKKKKN